MRIATYKLKVTVKDGKATLDQSTKELVDNGDGTEFDETKISLKANEVAEHNRVEITTVESMGDGDKFVELKYVI